MSYHVQPVWIEFKVCSISVLLSCRSVPAVREVLSIHLVFLALGMRVSYPQYVRLVALQEKVIKLDLVMRRMQSQVPREELENVPKWHTLVALHDSLKKMLPPEYTAR